MQYSKGRATRTGHKPLNVAHRGWHRDHIENTMEAFRAAYAAGCDMVEFDVQLSKDGVPLVFHDNDCVRLLGRKDKVYEMDWKELRTLSMSAAKNSSNRTAAYRIPSLEEFLAEFGRKAFYLELKVPEAKADDTTYVHSLGEISARMVKAARPNARTFLASFHGGILRHLAQKKSFPLIGGIFETYDRFQEVHSGTDSDTAAAIRYYSVSLPIFQKFLQADWNGKDVNRMDNILIWNIDREKDFQQAVDRGVAGIVTDNVETLLAAN